MRLNACLLARRLTGRPRTPFRYDGRSAESDGRPAPLLRASVSSSAERRARSMEPFQAAVAFAGLPLPEGHCHRGWPPHVGPGGRPGKPSAATLMLSRCILRVWFLQQGSPSWGPDRVGVPMPVLVAFACLALALDACLPCLIACLLVCQRP